jgi:hypothetical protein
METVYSANGYGVSLLVVPVPGSDEYEGTGTEYRCEFHPPYSDDERPAESLRTRGNGRMDWTRSRSSGCAFGGDSANSQTEGTSSGVVVPVENGCGLSSGLSGVGFVYPSV